MAERKVMIIGLDAVTPDLVGPWAAEGCLPNLARLMAQGAAGPLRSTIPPVSPPAWSTFATGTNPGRHGILNFHQFLPEAYEPFLMNAAMRRGETFWEVAGRHGIRGGIINMPLSFPPRPFDGFLITGMMTPSVGPGMASPPEVLQDLLAASPDYAIDVNLISAPGRDPRAFLDRALANLRARLAAAVGLYRKHRPALFCVVFVAADRVCHYFWPYLEAGRAGQVLTPEQRRLADAVKTVYRALDEAVGALLNEAGGETDVLILSDHGAGGLRKGLSLRRALAREGLLTEKTLGPVARWQRAAVAAFARRAPRSLTRRIQSLLPRTARKAAAMVATAGIDFRRSKAYPTGSSHGIFVNLQGRQACGIVQPGDEYEAVREQVVTALSQLRDPETGRPALRRVYRREDVWWGACLERLPDLIVEPEDRGYALQMFAEEPGSDVFYDLPEPSWTALRRLGGHRPEGILMAMGPHVKTAKLSDANIVDVPATVLALLGCPIPDSFDGRVLTEILSDDVDIPARVRDDPDRQRQSRDFSEDDRDAVEKRLKGLGYL